MNSADSGDKDRDGTMRGADIFDVAHFPTAHYVTRSFTKTATGYSAVGALTLHGVTKDVPIEFKFAPGAAGADTRAARRELKRLDFGVGQGDWKSTDWVADAVKVAFSLQSQAEDLASAARRLRLRSAPAVRAIFARCAARSSTARARRAAGA